MVGAETLWKVVVDNVESVLPSRGHSGSRLGHVSRQHHSQLGCAVPGKIVEELIYETDLPVADDRDCERRTRHAATCSRAGSRCA